ncbi:hypothetical protein BD408DRAFT_434674 [Parasitella parasitica]|nr:hypothetical protein BD408DRAFT_434674 [Parasitella parasitica]
MFGDGKSQEVIGIARNLQLRVGESNLVSISAFCFIDVGDKYDFIIGREGLHTLNIGTDWSSHYWHIKTKEAVIPLDVHYVKNHNREGNETEEDRPQDADISEYSDEEDHIDQEDSEEGYLIVEASDNEKEPSKSYFSPVEDPEKRLGRLIENILAQDNIIDEDKKRVVDLIEEFNQGMFWN